MTTNVPSYTQGDWIVHIHYGVGQVRGIEKKILFGIEHSYYRVTTRDSVFWIPVDQTESDRLRPIASPRELKQALDILSNPHREMDRDHNERKRRINNLKSDGSLASMAKLVRDLWVRRNKQKRLNASEEQILNRCQERFLMEWAVCNNIEVEEARERLKTILQQHLA